MWKNGSTLKGLNVNKGFVFNQIGKCYIYQGQSKRPITIRLLPKSVVLISWAAFKTETKIANTFSTGCTKAIISRSELLRFNPFGVEAYQTPLPQVSPVAIHIQPLRG
jgi:hypothetical protein